MLDAVSFTSNKKVLYIISPCNEEIVFLRSDMWNIWLFIALHLAALSAGAYLTRPYHVQSPSRTQYSYSYGYKAPQRQNGYYYSVKSSNGQTYSSAKYKEVNVSKELIQIMRKQTFEQPITFNDTYLAKVAKIVRAVPDGTYVRVDYLVAPSECTLETVISLEHLYSASCPVKKDAKWRHCKGFFSEQNLYTLSIYCEQFVPAEKENLELLYPNMIEILNATEEVSTVKPPASFPTYKDEVEVFLKQRVFHSKFRIGHWYTRVMKVYEWKETESKLYVKFAVAPTTCYRDDVITFEQLYSDMCSLMQVDAWLVCTAYLPLEVRDDYKFTCDALDEFEGYRKNSSIPAVQTTTPTVPAVKIDVPTTITEIKHFIHESHIQVGGWHAKFMKLIQVKVVDGSIYAELAIAPSQCSSQQKIPFEKLYSSLCPVSDVPEWTLCTVTMPLDGRRKRVVTCEGTMKAEKIENPEPEPEEKVPTPTPAVPIDITPTPTPAPIEIPKIPTPTPAAPIEITTMAPTASPETSTDRSEVISSIKRFLLESKVQLGGWHAKFVKLTKFEQIGNSVHVEFALAPSECSAQLKVTLYQLYSPFCPTMQAAEWLLCRGEMPPDSQSHFLMTCGDRMKAELDTEDGSSATPTPDQGASTTNMTERKNVIEAIKQFIHNVRIEVNGHHARVVKLYRYETRANNILVEFALAQSCCKISEQVSILQLYSTACAIVPSDHWLLCNGAIPYSGRSGYSLSCAERIEADPALPTDVEDPLKNSSGSEEEKPTTPRETTEPTSDDVVGKVKEYIFTSKVQVDGFHARVVKFYKHVERSSGIDVELDIAPTNCSLSQKIAFDTLYSDACPIADSKFWVRCSGTIPNNGNGYYSMKCKRTVTTGRDDTVEVTTAAPQVPPPTSESTDDSDLDEHSRVFKIIKHILFAEHMEINGWYARLAELKILSKDEFGSYVEFTIAPTECRSTLKILLQMLYSDSCPIKVNSARTSCTGLVPTQIGGKHRITCGSSVIDSEKGSEILPTLPEEVPEHGRAENITAELKEMLFSEQIEIGGWRARLTELIEVTDVDDKTHVRFIIAPSKCSVKAKITMEHLYSTSCPVLDVGVLVLCEGYLPFSDDNAFQCQLSNKKTSDVTPKPPVIIDPSDSVQISSIVSRLVFDKQLEIDGKYPRFLALLDTHAVGSSVRVEFTLAPTECSKARKITIDELYSHSCPLQAVKVLLVCEVMIPFASDGKIKCEKRLPHNEMRERIILKNHTTRMDSSKQLAQVYAFTKQLLFDRKLDFNGFYPKIVQMFTSTYEKGSLSVRFVIAATSCSNSLKITLGKLYSKSCPIQDRSKFTLCKAVIRLEYKSTPTLDCDSQVEAEEKNLTVPCAPTDTEDFCRMSTIDLLNHIKKAIFVERVYVSGCYPKLVEVKELERRGNEAYFKCSIAPSKCKLGQKLSFEELYSIQCPLLSSKLIMECEGYLSSGAAKKYRVNCFGSSGGLTYEAQDHAVPLNMENPTG
ncbi:hypothetical protein M514_01527 [Trichuris suis]|uniref:Uncharacterized protein n=1 Tax=Trichuris suis TaxID=68888 RepID=A0A085NAN4_9BILA|nr:hypothetical protein M514_01527 [Trichuris suis]